ncbi:unnamed protein product, partial [Mesorhabditis spiculigera]
MDAFVLDEYVWPYVPLELDDATKKEWNIKFVNFIGWMDWLCKYQPISQLIENHLSFLLGEIMFVSCCLLTFIHAYRNRERRYLYVWIAITIHAFNVENLCYNIPDMDNFWQAQGVLTFFGARAPLYILFGIYHTFDYCAYVAVQKLHLPWWAEGPAVGLGAVMLDLPYDILGIKNLWWTWHDTDPNIYDRFYWVPWNSFYFHASFACSLVWLLHLTRRYIVDVEYDWRKIHREFLCSFLAGVSAFWLGTLQFVPIYHTLHDFYKVHSEITTILFLSTYALIVICADRRRPVEKPESRAGDRWWFDEVPLAISIEYIFFMVLVVVCDPVNIVQDGLHQAIGPCKDKQKVQTPTGKVLYKNKYLCATNYDEKYFDFHCLPNGGKAPEQQRGEPLEWYAVCGTEFENRAEYIAIVWGCCILFGTIFYQMLARSGELPDVPQKVLRKRPVAEKAQKKAGEGEPEKKGE